MNALPASGALVYNLLLNMYKLNFRQLQRETESWKRLIVLLTEENNQLKNRLAETLKNDVSQTTLVELENFQTDFVSVDELIYLTRRDIAECDKLLREEKLKGGTLNKKIFELWKDIGHSITTTEIRFWKIKSDFNRYLVQKNFAQQTG